MALIVGMGLYFGRKAKRSMLDYFLSHRSMRRVQWCRMSRVFFAGYDAREQTLRLAEPLPGLKDHERVRVSLEKDNVPLRPTVDDPLARLFSLEAPTGDIEQMLAEIEAGRR